MLAGRYSFLDRDAETLMSHARARCMGPVLAGVYGSGILAAPKDGRHKFNFADADPAIVGRVEALRADCDGHGVPLAAAIRFPMRHPATTAVVIGAKTAAWFDTDLPEAIWPDLDAALTSR